MLTRKQGIAGIVITLFVGSGLLYLNPWQSDSPFIDPADQSLVLQGKKIYATNCASCHGANLEGQSNWRQRLPNGRLPAPPHDVTGHTWHHADSLLIDIVKKGLIPGRTAPPGYQSDMPAYGSVLSDEEIRAVLAYIKSSWPLQALQAQKDMTLKQNH